MRIAKELNLEAIRSWLVGILMLKMTLCYLKACILALEVHPVLRVNGARLTSKSCITCMKVRDWAYLSTMDLILEIGAIPPITPGIIMKKTHNGISLNGSLIFTNGAVKREST